MKKVAQKLKKLEQEIASEKGKVFLFALFAREDPKGIWDILVAAPWISRNKTNSTKYITGKIKETLTNKEMLKLSRIVIIDEHNPALDKILHGIKIEHEIVEIKDSEFFGLPIRHAFLITSKGSVPKIDKNSFRAKDKSID